jgi:DNA adenine methylase
VSAIPSPFPYFGGKRKIVADVWQRFGTVSNYVEPFAGTAACLFARPEPFSGNETINDVDGMVANFFRSVKLDPEATAERADWPVNENDLHARHAWLVGQKETLRANLEGSPDWCDPKIAGWWVWGMSCWIGSGFCSGRGPWGVVDGQLVHLGDNGRGVNRQLVHLGNNGQGDASGVSRQMPSTNLSHVAARTQNLQGWFRAISDRLSRVRVCSGDWSRVCGPSVTYKHGLTAVFLDPPYADTAERTDDLYTCDSDSVAHDVREWAIENGKRKDMRIALCGYDGEHKMPGDWEELEWNAGEGFGGQATERSGNGKRERVWFSPACLSARQVSIFERLAQPLVSARGEREGG